MAPNNTCQSCTDDLCHPIDVSLTQTPNFSVMHFIFSKRVPNLMATFINHVVVKVTHPNPAVVPNYTFTTTDLGDNRLALNFYFPNHFPPGGQLSVYVTNNTFPNSTAVASSLSSGRLLQNSNTTLSVFNVKQSNLSVPISEQYNLDNSTTAQLAATGSATNGAGNGNQAATGVTAVAHAHCSSTSHHMMNFQLFNSIRYLGINFPPNTLYFFSTLPATAVTLDFMPNFPEQGTKDSGSGVVA
jgi:hypothetical protein